MEWHGRQTERTIYSDLGSDTSAYSHSIDPHSYYDGPNLGSTLPRQYFSPNPRGESYSNFESHHYGDYSTSPFIQGPVAAFQAPTLPISAAPRVHINPNYRPKASYGPDKDLSSNRPSSVHINPHWRPRVDPAAARDHSLQSKNCSNPISGKKTIFVNPKVLARMNLKCPIQVTAKDLVPVPPPVSLVPGSDSSSAFSILTAATKSQMKNSGIDEATCQTTKEFVEPTSASENSFVMLSSRKLIRKSNITSQQKILNSIEMDGPVLPKEAVGSAIEICSKKLNPSSVPTLKIARQVSSKYKLVRNASVQSTTKTSRGTLVHPSKRPRRKSINSKFPSATSKSLYKFIRKSGVGDTLIGSSTIKASSKFGNIVLFPGQNTWRENSIGKGSSSNARRSTRTRFRLVKVQPSHQSRQAVLLGSVPAKDMQSRYKIIRQGWAGSKSSVQLNNTPVCGFPLYSPLVRSKFKSLGGIKMSPGRKVSRFRITQTSKTRLKAHGITKISNPHHGSKPSKPEMSRSGLYRNIIWQKNKALAPSLLNIDHQTANMRKDGGAPSSVKISNRSLVNIGGVLYRSTRTSLTRTHTGKSKERIVHIRGNSFVMDGQGKTLRPATSTDNSIYKKAKNGNVLSIARVDIGGVTFTRRTDNTLVRTNTHFARNLLSIAKTRSIARLTDKLRKNNQPCLIYHRFGKCHSQEKGKCWRVHDPKNIAICRKFLQGNCETEKCLLSHNVGPEKMPTCRYFLEGCCVRDDCPYLHVKLSAHAAICRQFLHGYCAAGDMCKKRHVHLCPDFERDGKCCKGKYCPYPHKGSTKANSKKKTTTITTKHPSSIRKKSDTIVGGKTVFASVGEAEKRKRYYDENGRVSKQSPGCNGLDSEALCLDPPEKDINHEDSDTLQKRPKIGILPAYIPL